MPAPHRMRSSGEFARTIRAGVRAGRPSLVVHARLDDQATGSPVRVGFVVSKAVGDAVSRNRVKRRLRHLVAGELDTLPADCRLVVRALPAASGEPARLAGDLSDALGRVRRRLGSAS
nr:ribonuclease P protein component [Auraticoccus cholistanensis]